MKDYFDLRALAREGALDGGQLGEAIAATFARRRTEVPTRVPPALGEEFALDVVKQAQWNAFLARNQLVAPPFGEVVAEVRNFVLGPLRLARIRKATGEPGTSS